MSTLSTLADHTGVWNAAACHTAAVVNRIRTEATPWGSVTGIFRVNDFSFVLPKPEHCGVPNLDGEFDPGFVVVVVATGATVEDACDAGGTVDEMVASGDGGTVDKTEVGGDGVAVDETEVCGDGGTVDETVAAASAEAVESTVTAGATGAVESTVTAGEAGAVDETEVGGATGAVESTVVAGATGAVESTNRGACVPLFATTPTIATKAMPATDDSTAGRRRNGGLGIALRPRSTPAAMESKMRERSDSGAAKYGAAMTAPPGCSRTARLRSHAPHSSTWRAMRLRHSGEKVPSQSTRRTFRSLQSLRP